MHAPIGSIDMKKERSPIYNTNVCARDILPRLDRLVSDLCALGLYEYADRLEEFTGDLEEDLMKEGYTVD
jgi:hypothetical protein